MIESLIDSIIGRRNMTATEKLVIVAIAKQQAGRMWATLSRKDIGKRCGLSDATVKRAVTDLTGRGIILCRRKKLSPERHEKNTYSVVWVNNFNRKRNWLKRQEISEVS